MAVQVPRVVGACSAAVVFALGAANGSPSSPSDEVRVPEQLADYSYLTDSVSSSPPGAAVALYQHGFGVEFLDFPQAVVLGSGGNAYRRVDVAENRAGGETQGDPAPMLLSPDGTTVAVGDHDIDRPDVVLVDLVTGATTSHSLPPGRSVVPIAWSSDGRRLAHLISPAPTNPHLGVPIVGDVAILDLDDDSTTLLRQGGQVSAAAFAPDGTELVLQQDGASGGQLSVVDLASGSRRVVGAAGELAGPAAWSPDGRLLATITPGSEISFVDATGRGGRTPAPLDLPLSPPGQVLGWSGLDEILVLLTVPGADPCCGAEAYSLSSAPLDGSQPRTLTQITGLQSYGVSRFQLASATTAGLEVVTADDVDRGGLPLPLRGGWALLVGMIAWGATRGAWWSARTLGFARAAPAAPSAARAG